ncbi:MAG: hemerythrin domain-containing protein [Myxococcales bacterium]|nr:hemerythrin domain-containing protein [Myxococcales bacterium]MDH3484413.1 hemerythrin domain-containing protein [Myxococcales bacterium]
MSDDTLMPSEIRQKVLTQHREIEQMLSELEVGARQLREGEQEADRVKRAAYALRGILELHMTFEETHMVPAISEADGFGPERARHLHAEHAEQRAHLDRLVHAILDARAPTEIEKGVADLAQMLRKDIEEEEKHYVNEKLLRDSLMPTDTFGG